MDQKFVDIKLLVQQSVGLSAENYQELGRSRID